MSVGNIVIIQEDNENRRFWRLGLVEDVIPGRDDEIRGAVVKVYNPRGGNCKRIRRPMQRLYPILKLIVHMKGSHKMVRTLCMTRSQQSQQSKLRM